MKMDPQFFESIMTFMLPIIMNVFQNRTEPEYQAKFKKPCEFKDMINMFSTLPPYFNEIGRLYPNKTDLIAYYSMQLSSTFLVNQGSLTMDCLYNMLDLQSRLGSFAIGILDHPENYVNEVGQFGLHMKSQAGPLRNNAMLQILEYVDKYEKNNDKDQTVALFTTFNIIFVIISVIGILANFIIILVLKRAGYRSIKKTNSDSKREFLATTNSSHIGSESEDDSNSSSDINGSTDLNYRYYLLSKRYRTRVCIMIISFCHLLYLKINFIIMSQFQLAAVALGQLNKSQVGCKMAFFLFPPTTPYNILHQYAIWLLIYALNQHSKKIRRIKYVVEDGEDYLFADNHQEFIAINRPSTESIRPIRTASLNLKSTNQRATNSRSCGCFKESSKNIVNCILIFILIVLYNAQNLFFYSINDVFIVKQNVSIKFCAFDPFYSNYYLLISQHIVPMLNLLLFLILPMIIGVLYLSFDLCLFIRLKREQNKLYLHLKEYHIEWLIYIYFIIFFISQMPLFIHQVADYVTQNIKFPFVFPLFIGLIFSTKVGLVLFEMSMLCFGYSISFLFWCLFDNDFINIIKFYFNKYVLCRTLKVAHDDHRTVKRRPGLGTTTNSLISYKPNANSKNIVIQQSEKKNMLNDEDEERHHFSTSSTSTNDDKIDEIKVYNENKLRMIDDDSNDINHLTPLNFSSKRFSQSPKKLALTKTNVKDPNYENTDIFFKPQH